MNRISKYIDDERFIRWVFSPNETDEKYWVNYQNQNPAEKENIILAFKVLSQFKVKEQNLNEYEKIVLFTQILKQIEKKENSKTSKYFIQNLLKYAAVAILFFAVGALVFYHKNDYISKFKIQNLTESSLDGEGRLIRANGDKISLTEKRSIIEYAENGEVRVNDKIIKPTQKEHKKTPLINEVLIPYGQTSEIILPDGSTVILNAGSRLAYPESFIDKNREVLLFGEAFFEVKKDEKHPFIVQTTDLKIKVLGTKFNVSAYPFENVIETVLTEGKVKISQLNSGLFSETTEMVPNTLASFNKSTRKTKVCNVDTDNYTLWTKNILKLSGTDFSRVIKKLERYYNIRFKYDNPLLGAVKISGKLDLNDNREEVINRVAVAASVKINLVGKNYYVIK